MNEIRYQKVSKTYGGQARPAVRAVSLTIEQGQFAVFLGPSGCGKTTLLKMTNRLVEPSSGTITLDGQDILRLPAIQLRRRMGYVIQQVGLFPHMTVAQNVAVVPELLGWPKARVRARVAELLALVELPPEIYAGRLPGQLSGGQQQRVGLARALAADPDLLLMDEPFGALDAITRAQMQDEIRALRRRLQKTVLFVTHDVDEAFKLADVIVVLRAGEVVQVGPPCELLENPADDFVRDLLGADDRVRRLGLLAVDAVMEPLPPDLASLPEGLPRLPSGSSLRQALGLFLQPGVANVLVTSGDAPVGLLTFDRLRNAGCQEAHELLVE